MNTSDKLLYVSPKKNFNTFMKLTYSLLRLRNMIKGNFKCMIRGVVKLWATLHTQP